MSEVLTIGEPMALLAAEEVKPLKDVSLYRRYVCGAEINVSVGLARLKHTVSYISWVGNDPFGECIKDFLQKNNIDTSYLKQHSEYLTGIMLKEKVLSGDPKTAYFRKGAAFSHFIPEEIEKINWDGVQHLHVTGISLALSQNCQDSIEKLMNVAKKRNVKISFDPNIRPALWKTESEMVTTLNHFASKADIILPGISEGEILTGSRDPEKIADFYMRLGAGLVVVKLGTKGAFAKSKDGDIVTSAGFKVDHVVDTVGAGDGFAVGIISALLEKLPLSEVLRRATAIGAMAVMFPGDNDGLPDRGALNEFMNQK